MNLPTLIPNLTVQQFNELPSEQLHNAQITLLEFQSAVKQALDCLNAALEIRYGERAREARLAAGKDFGVIHLDDHGVRVTVDSPKRTTWEKQQLSESARRIAASGERVEDYLDVEYSIPESRYTNWPPFLREQFASARTVKPGKTSFRLALVHPDISQE